jgi:hypothetical protein
MSRPDGEERICVRWQEVVPDGTGLGSRLVYSCECNGDGCPLDPRRHARRGDRDPNRGNRRIPLAWFSAADELGLNDV